MPGSSGLTGPGGAPVGGPGACTGAGRLCPTVGGGGGGEGECPESELRGGVRFCGLRLKHIYVVMLKRHHCYLVYFSAK